MWMESGRTGLVPQPAGKRKARKERTERTRFQYKAKGSKKDVFVGCNGDDLNLLSEDIESDGGKEEERLVKAV
eukprot:11191653-Ditylum_brightwellii.AAC.1